MYTSYLVVTYEIKSKVLINSTRIIKLVEHCNNDCEMFFCDVLFDMRINNKKLFELNWTLKNYTYYLLSDPLCVEVRVFKTPYKYLYDTKPLSTPT